MNRFFVLSALMIASFFTGVVSISIGESELPDYESNWLPTSVPDKALESKAVSWLMNSSRWEVVDELDQRRIATEGFTENYRLIAVIDNEFTYALLEAMYTEDGELLPVSRVSVGDLLPSGWVVSEIEKAAVVATREDESQRVELFPRK